MVNPLANITTVPYLEKPFSKPTYASAQSPSSIESNKPLLKVEQSISHTASYRSIEHIHKRQSLG